MLGLRPSIWRPLAPVVRHITSQALPKGSLGRWTKYTAKQANDEQQQADDEQQQEKEHQVLPVAMGKVNVHRLERTGKTGLRHLLLSNLPLTATPEDIKQLCTSAKNYNSLGRIEYLYNRHMQRTGQAFVSFASSDAAIEYAQANDRRILGDGVLRGKLYDELSLDDYLTRYYGYWPAEYQLPFDLIEYDPAKLVLLSNVPQLTTEARMEERLSPRYDLRPQDRWRGRRKNKANFLVERKGYGGTHDAVLGSVFKLPKVHPDATTVSFVARCQTPQEAMRLVRRWHNTYFAPATFGIQDTAGSFRIEASILY